MPPGTVISAFALANALGWVLLVLAWRRRRHPSGPALVVVAAVVVAWTAVSLWATLTDDLPVRLAILRAQFAFSLVAPPAWLWVASHATRDRRLGWRSFALVAAPAAVGVAAFVAQPFAPGALIELVETATTGGRVVLTFTMGPWFWAAVVPYAYLLLVAAAVLLAQSWSVERGSERRQVLALALAMAPPIVASLMQATGANPLEGYDLTGLSLGASAFLFIGALSTTRLFDRGTVAYREVFVAMRDPALIVGSDGRLIDANPAARRLLALDGGGGTGGGTRGAGTGGDVTRRGGTSAALLAIAPQLEAARRYAGDQGARRALAGDLAGFVVNVSHLRDGRGALNASVLIVHDRREERDREAQLFAEAHRDPLTGIGNRRGFEASMAAALTSRGQRAVGVAFIDLDGFKAVNDTHGHQVGDAVLVEIAVRLTRLVRDGDIVARLGGDEFALLLPDVSPLDLALVRERVEASLSVPIDADGASLRVGGSVGLASAPRDGTTVEALLERADARMYREKQGRHAVLPADPDAATPRRA